MPLPKLPVVCWRYLVSLGSGRHQPCFCFPFGNLPMYVCLCVHTPPVYKDTSHTKLEPT